jgi:hypothetical protein
MRLLFKLGLCLTLFALPAFRADAKPRNGGRPPPAVAQARDPDAILLPEDLTNSNDWLEDNRAATHGPTGQSRMMRQQQNFQQQDPTRGTAVSPYER